MKSSAHLVLWSSTSAGPGAAAGPLCRAGLPAAMPPCDGEGPSRPARPTRFVRGSLRLHCQKSSASKPHKQPSKPVRAQLLPSPLLGGAGRGHGPPNGIAHKMDKRIGFDTASRMAADAAFVSCPKTPAPAPPAPVPGIDPLDEDDLGGSRSAGFRRIGGDARSGPHALAAASDRISDRRS